MWQWEFPAVKIESELNCTRIVKQNKFPIWQRFREFIASNYDFLVFLLGRWVFLNLFKHSNGKWNGFHFSKMIFGTFSIPRFWNPSKRIHNQINLRTTSFFSTLSFNVWVGVSWTRHFPNSGNAKKIRNRHMFTSATGALEN